MAKKECEHDADFYQIIAGSGLKVTEQCSECGNIITHEQPRVKYAREQKKKSRKK